jgi:hypothetical protein
MQRQLLLLEDGPRDFRLDDATKERGRRGIAEAKRLLAEVIEKADADKADGAHRTNRAA